MTRNSKFMSEMYVFFRLLDMRWRSSFESREKVDDGFPHSGDGLLRCWTMWPVVGAPSDCWSWRRPLRHWLKLFWIRNSCCCGWQPLDSQTLSRIVKRCEARRHGALADQATLAMSLLSRTAWPVQWIGRRGEALAQERRNIWCIYNTWHIVYMTYILYTIYYICVIYCIYIYRYSARTDVPPGVFT